MPNEPTTASGATWQLPVRILDVEIGSGISDIAGCTGYAGSRVLVRRRGVPLGWIDLSCAGDVIDAREILPALRNDIGAQARRAAANDALDSHPTSHPLPPISVVVCTRDRSELLARCLRSLAQLDYPTYEVVVVDNAPTSDATRQVADAAGARYVREDLPGLDRARNRGLASARNDIVAYTDDDAEVDRLWLRGIASGFADPSVQLVTGLVAPGRMDTEAELLFEMCYGGMGKGTRPGRWDPSRLSHRALIGTHHLGVGANMAFRRSLLQSLGGFDAALDVGTEAHGGGDLDMFHRALMHGAVAQYEPRALVRHYHRRDLAALRRQHYDNGRAFGVYLLTLFRRGAIPRRLTAWYSLRIWLAWLVARLIKRLAGRDTLPAGLIVAELWGACHAPWAYQATYRQARARGQLATGTGRTGP